MQRSKEWRGKKAFLSDQGKEIEENYRMRKTRDLFKEIVVTKGTFPVKMGKIKNRNGKDLPKQKGLIKSGKNTQKNCTKKRFTTQIITNVRSLIYSQSFWNVTSSGP